MESSLLDRVAGIISRYSMTVPGQRAGVAVSGGADSVCLLHVLKELAPALQIQLAIVHLNHKLRADESDEDESFVAHLAESLGYPLWLCRENVADAEGNLEQAGREARLRFFRTLMAEGKVDWIATGHTRSDQAETVLYRLLRGSGTAGLCGVKPKTEDGLIRPLLDCNRHEIEAYLTERSIAWRNDSSNANLTFVRNRIRRHLLPQLQRDYNPALPQALAQMALLAQDEELYWTGEVDRLSATLLKGSGGAVLLRCPDLLALPKAVGRRLLRRAIENVKGDLRRIGFEHVEALLELASGGEGHGRLQIPDLDIFRSFEWLRIGRPRDSARADRDYSFSLSPPVSVRVPGQDIVIHLDVIEFPSDCRNGHGKTGYTERESRIDIKWMTEPLELRNWRPGDRFTRVGRPSEKIKALFQEGRVPIWERQGWPVLTSGGQIVWARRFGASAEVSPSAETTHVVRVVEIAEAGLADGAHIS